MEKQLIINTLDLIDVDVMVAIATVTKALIENKIKRKVYNKQRKQLEDVRDKVRTIRDLLDPRIELL